MLKRNNGGSDLKIKDESSIGTISVCNRRIVQIELLKIVLWWIGVDFAETRVKIYIFFVIKFIKQRRHTKKYKTDKNKYLIEKILYYIIISVKCILWNIYSEIVENQDFYRKRRLLKKLYSQNFYFLIYKM